MKATCRTAGELINGIMGALSQSRRLDSAEDPGECAQGLALRCAGIANAMGAHSPQFQQISEEKCACGLLHLLLSLSFA